MRKYAASLTELKDVWRSFRFSTLGIYAELKEREEDNLAKKTRHVKTDTALEIETREVLKEDMKYFFEAPKTI